MAAITEYEKEMARTILLAFKINQDSYDETAAKAAAEELSSHEELYLPDFTQFYRIPLDEACERAAAETGIGIALGRVLFFAMEGATCKDMVDWAHRVLDPTASEAPTRNNCQHGLQYDQPNGLIDPLLDYETCEKCRDFYADLKREARKGIKVVRWRG